MTATLIDTRVKPSVNKLYREILYFFPEVAYFYGGSDTPDHNTKRCLDIMVAKIGTWPNGLREQSDSARLALGNRVAAFLIKNAAHYKINGIIWNKQRMGFPHTGGTNNYHGPAGQWFKYTGPNPHTDHVHVDQDGSDFVSLIPSGELPSFPVPDSNELYLDKIAAGVTDSDSVWYMQNALRILGFYTGNLTGDYDAATIAGAKAYQASLGDTVRDGLLGPLQLTKALRDAGLSKITIYNSSVTGGVWVKPTDPVPTVPPKEPEPTVEDTVTLFYLNILRRTDPDKKRKPYSVRKGLLIKTIREADADVVVLIETDGTTRRDLCPAGWSYWGYKYYGIYWNPAKFRREKDAVNELALGENRFLLSLPLVNIKTGTEVIIDASHLENDGDPTTDGHSARFREATKWAANVKTGNRMGGCDFNSTTLSTSGSAKNASSRTKQKPRVVLAQTAGYDFATNHKNKITNSEYDSHHGGLDKTPKNSSWIDDVFWRGSKIIFVDGKMILTSDDDASDHNGLKIRFKITK